MLETLNDVDEKLVNSHNVFLNFDDFYKPLMEWEKMSERKQKLLLDLSEKFNSSEKQMEFLDQLSGEMTCVYQKFLKQINDEWWNLNMLWNLIWLGDEKNSKIIELSKAANTWDIKKLKELWCNTDNIELSEDSSWVMTKIKWTAMWAAGLTVWLIPLNVVKNYWKWLSEEAKRIFTNVRRLTYESTLEILNMESDDVNVYINNISNTRDDIKLEILWMSMVYVVIEFLENKYVGFRNWLEPINDKIDFIESMDTEEDILKLDSRINSISSLKDNIQAMIIPVKSTAEKAAIVADNIKSTIDSTKIFLGLAWPQLISQTRVIAWWQVIDTMEELKRETMRQLTENSRELHEQIQKHRVIQIRNRDFLIKQMTSLEQWIKDVDKKYLEELEKDNRGAFLESLNSVWKVLENKSWKLLESWDSK